MLGASGLGGGLLAGTPPAFVPGPGIPVAVLFGLAGALVLDREDSLTAALPTGATVDVERDDDGWRIVDDGETTHDEAHRLPLDT